MKLFSLVLIIGLVACDRQVIPPAFAKIEFIETIETCPLESYGSKKFCSINVNHRCNQICVENPVCCDTTKRLEKHI